MRLITTGFVAALAVVLSAVDLWAQQPGGRGRRSGPPQSAGQGRGGFGMPQHPLMTALDADKDGKISTAELKNAESSLTKLDRNQDGQLTREEIGLSFGRFGGPGGPGRGRPPQGRAGRAAEGAVSFESTPIPKDDAEKKILTVLDEMNKNERRGMMNVPVEDGRLLRLLAEAVGAKHVVEIGTSNGYSGIWQCLALRTTGGKLTTHEIDARRASLARQNFKRAGVDQLITLVEGDAHEEVKKITEPIDILFLDADKEGYIDYLKKLLPLVRPGGLIVAHNMNQRQAHLPFVKAITTNPDLETLFLHMDAAGVAVSLKKR